MADSSLQDFLLKFNKNYNLLREREAKYATAAPLNLLNQIDDYVNAIQLAEQAVIQNLRLDQLPADFNGLNLQRKAVPPVCDRAIELAPEKGLFYNSRGLVRSLLGDQAEALEDFKFVGEWLQQNKVGP